MQYLFLHLFTATLAVANQKENYSPPTVLGRSDAWTLGTENKEETAAEVQLQKHNNDK